MNVTFAEVAAKLLNQLERGLITHSDYIREMKFRYDAELRRVANTQKEWVLTELNPEMPSSPTYYETKSLAEDRVRKYQDDYDVRNGKSYGTRSAPLPVGEGTVYSFVDGDGDVATFVIQKRSVTK